MKSKSCFIDTNCLLRLLLKDNQKQFKIVYNLFQKAIRNEIKAFTSLIVFFEIYWVLSSFYHQRKLKCLSYLEKILKIEFVEIKEREILKKALALYKKTRLDLEDCYNVVFAQSSFADEFITFDKKLLKVVNLSVL